MKTQIVILQFLILSFAALPVRAQSVPTAENLQNRQNFQDMKFGVFIHWGIYSMLADGEWVMQIKNINHLEYRKLAEGFYPSKFNAQKWVADVKAAGAKYICITTRHHDGFSMFNSRFTGYNITDATPYKRDIIRELADECHKQGIKLHFYYSLLDWDREDYYPRGETGKGTGRTGTSNWITYHQFMKDQLTELLTNYGEIGAIWFDGKWDQPAEFDWKLQELYGLIHRIQPGCLVINNHHLAPLDGEDAQTFERDLPGQNTAGFSKDSSVGSLPLETCETMNKSWGYNIKDNNYKSEKELLHYLVKTAGNNANLLMNVGPQPNGEFPAEAVSRMRKLGEWLDDYGETIYGTRGGVLKPREWGVATRKDKNVYLHILNLKDSTLLIPVSDIKIKSARIFITKEKVKFKQNKDGILFNLSKVPDEIDYVLELTIK